MLSEYDAFIPNMLDSDSHFFLFFLLMTISMYTYVVVPYANVWTGFFLNFSFIHAKSVYWHVVTCSIIIVPIMFQCLEHVLIAHADTIIGSSVFESSIRIANAKRFAGRRISDIFRYF